jgi:hypothetical protein
VLGGWEGIPIMSNTDTEYVARAEVAREFSNRGWTVTDMGRSREGNLLAKKNGRCLRIRVRGLAKLNAVWLEPEHVGPQIDLVVVCVIEGPQVWVLTRQQALLLMEAYRRDYKARNGHLPPANGWNVSLFPPPSGWGPLNRL